jgi:3-deoxy-D-manno-octulosonate 8-phosphate phosphatase (KDO 8-P phosphatase)
MPLTDPSIIQAASKIKLFAFDVDGVMTDGSLYIGNSGEEFKCFNVLDGQGIKFLTQCSIATAIITKRRSQLLQVRAQELGIVNLYQGCEDKLTTLKQLADKLEINLGQVAYLGDDLPDLPVITQVGLGLTVPGGHKTVKQYATASTVAGGGKGAVREVCDLILEASGNMSALVASFGINIGINKS